MTRLARLAGLAAAAALAGCSTTPPPAVLTFAGQGCAPAPNLGGAISLTPAKAKQEHIVTTKLETTSPCLDQAGAKRPYALYALPVGAMEKTLTVGAVTEQARVFAPDVTVLDAGGRTTRTFQPHEYFFRGDLYSVQFVPREGDAFVLVTADPTKVGQRYEAVATGTATTSTYAGGLMMTWTSGIDQKIARTYSYAGSVQAVVHDPAAKTKKP